MYLSERILVMKKVIAVLSVAALISTLSAASFAATTTKHKIPVIQKIFHKHEKKAVTGQKTGGAAPIKPEVKKEVKKHVKKIAPVKGQKTGGAAQVKIVKKHVKKSK